MDIYSEISIQIFFSGEAAGQNKSKKIHLANVFFHQCVSLESFHTKDPIISFIPPDGEFELMSYALFGSFLIESNKMFVDTVLIKMFLFLSMWHSLNMK
jgi:hypothetical protein